MLKLNAPRFLGDLGVVLCGDLCGDLRSFLGWVLAGEVLDTATSAGSDCCSVFLGDVLLKS